MPVTKFIWDELSDNVRMEVDDIGSVIAEYMNEAGQFGRLISQRRDGTCSFYHFDAPGSTRQVSNAAETVIDSYTYSAFGETIASSGLATTPFRYYGAWGYYFDDEKDEVYVRRRTYGPNNGRWLSADPLRFVDGPNVYIAYFIPNGIDPTGTKCNDCCCCAEDILIDNVTKINRKKIFGGPGGTEREIFGHAFDYHLRIRYVLNAGVGDCEHEYWEWATTKYELLNEKAFHWYDHAGLHAGGLNRWWTRHQRRIPCPGTEVFSGFDTPQIVSGEPNRELLIRIILRSGKNCDCRQKIVERCVYQILESNEVLDDILAPDPGIKTQELHFVPCGGEGFTERGWPKRGVPYRFKRRW